MILRLLFPLVLCLFWMAPANAYDPPVGIPDPSAYWGGTIDPIEDPVPPESTRCPNWPDNEQAGCYYVDSGHPDATDTDNLYGYPEKPRTSIPDGITLTGGPTGGYMRIVGPGPYTDTDTHNIVANGTAAYPVWITGRNHPVLRSQADNHALAVSGAYYIVDGVSMDRSEQGFAFAHPTNRGVFRNTTITAEGALATYGSQISGSGSSSASENNYLLVYNITMSGIGQWTTNDNADTHGIKIRNNVNHVWILNSEIYHCQGDSVQTGEASITGDDAPTHIYIGRNVFYENKENGIDIKDGDDIILSENIIYNMANQNGDDGAEGIVIHEEADHVYALCNTLHTCGIGLITTQSQHTWFIGNVIYNMEGSTDPDSHYGGGVAIHFRGDSGGGAINNTIYGCDKGIQMTAVAEGFQCRNNIISHRRDAAAYDVMANDTAHADTDFNLLYSNTGARILWGSSSPYAGVAAFRAATGECEHCPAEADPGYTDATTANFDISQESPAAGQGQDHAIYDLFFNRYGIDIKKDINKRNRPAGNWDIGAFETAESAGSVKTPQQPKLIKIIR